MSGVGGSLAPGWKPRWWCLRLAFEPLPPRRYDVPRLWRLRRRRRKTARLATQRSPSPAQTPMAALTPVEGVAFDGAAFTCGDESLVLDTRDAGGLVAWVAVGRGELAVWSGITAEVSGDLPDDVLVIVVVVASAVSAGTRFRQGAADSLPAHELHE